MITNPGTCLLKYSKITISYCNSFLDWGICSCSIFLQISKGNTTVPTIPQVLKYFTFYLVPDIYQMGLQLLLYAVPAMLMLLLPSHFWGKIL